MAATDEDTALEAITKLDPLSDVQLQAKHDVDQMLNSENSDPFVDVEKMFELFDVLYFRGLLKPRVEVLWSKRLTLCAGICELVKDDEGKYRRIRLKLSEPLLKYRPREDTVDTLIHEAIHAYMFVTTSWRHSRGDDGTGHGAGFLLLADAINNHGGYHVTVFHTFHDEVDSYRTHVWQCSGPCRTLPPHFGLVKRAMNRPPGKSDQWFQRHQDDCGGEWTKIAEPGMTQEQVRKMSARERAGLQRNKIDDWVKSTRQDASADQKRRVGKQRTDDHQEEDRGSLKRKWSDGDSYDSRESAKTLVVQCPICNKEVAEAEINQHLDEKHVS
ncbi:MAG: hypothetical protein M4579_003651 [Chaenotheca gracillima]|nr:MAG: hypothetical protein M4579_003651 [Chaenotheca gracillima]